jgi:hypothetical protein
MFGVVCWTNIRGFYKADISLKVFAAAESDPCFQEDFQTVSSSFLVVVAHLLTHLPRAVERHSCPVPSGVPAAATAAAHLAPSAAVTLQASGHCRNHQHFKSEASFNPSTAFSGLQQQKLVDDDVHQASDSPRY